MKTCPTCRAANLDSAVVCVRCSAMLGEPPMPGALTVMPEEPAPPSPDQIAQDKSRQARRAVIALVGMLAGLVVLVVLAISLLHRGDGFPDAIAGKPRIHTDALDEAAKQLEKITIEGMSVKVAFYGTGAQPSILVFTFHGNEDLLRSVTSDQFFSSFGAGVATGFTTTSGDSETASKPVTASIDGVDYLCIGVAGALGAPDGTLTRGSLCVFKKDSLGMLISMTYSDPHDAIGLAEQAAAAL